MSSMNDLVSISSRSAFLFNQVISASLLQPIGRNQSDFKSYRARVTLKISEHRNENTGEKELKLEVSRSEDYEFLFSECINHEKYQALAREYELTVDFEAFPRTIIDKLLSRNICRPDSEGENKRAPRSFADVAPTEVNLILDAERATCTFELVFKTPLSKGKIIGIKLNAVRGEQLTNHLLATIRAMEKKLVKSNEQMRSFEQLQKKHQEIEHEVETLREESSQSKELHEKVTELEEELQLTQDERLNLLKTIDDLRLELDDVKEQLNEDDNQSTNEAANLKAELNIVVKIMEEERAMVDRLQDEKDALKTERDNLQQEHSRLQKEFDKSMQIIEKYMSNQMTSFDARKKDELEADLKEKEDIIKTLSDTTAKLRSEIDDLKAECNKHQKFFDKLKDEHTELKREYDKLASIPRGPPMTPGYIQSPFGTPGSAFGPFATPGSNGNLGYKVVLGSGSNLADRTNLLQRTTSPYMGMNSPYERTFTKMLTPQKDDQAVNAQNVTPKVPQ